MAEQRTGNNPSPQEDALGDGSKPRMNWPKTLIWVCAGIGGMVPQLIKLAQILGTHPAVPPPVLGFYLALPVNAAIGLIGGMLASPMTTPAQGILAGVAAPSLLSYYTASSSSGQPASPPTMTAPKVGLGLVSTANAQPLPSRPRTEVRQAGPNELTITFVTAVRNLSFSEGFAPFPGFGPFGREFDAGPLRTEALDDRNQVIGSTYTPGHIV